MGLNYESKLQLQFLGRRTPILWFQLVCIQLPCICLHALPRSCVYRYAVSRAGACRAGNAASSADTAMAWCCPDTVVQQGNKSMNPQTAEDPRGSLRPQMSVFCPLSSWAAV